ncbi:MAG: CPBP family intramembrane metalloprotease [Chloroflexi bacterium]|nr:CPBP family intramembrane metalloprotease [Chloroflexota bacterium]
MNERSCVDWKRILFYTALACAIAWAGALIIHFTGGLSNSPYLVVVLTVMYMGAPSFAHILTRWITHEGWQNLYLKPLLRSGWPYWLVGWFGPGLLTVVGLVVFMLVFPSHYDPSLETVRRLVATQAGTAADSINPWTIVFSQALTAFLIAPIINALPTFGEEFGWRAYLLPKLMPLGERAALIVSSIIWGVWHWPLIAMGHNYGLDYPGAPWTGMLMMVWFTVVTGTLLGWAAHRSGSVWPAVIGHGALNGIAAIGVLVIRGQPNPLLGPTPVGFIGAVGFTVVALAILAVSPRQRSASQGSE